jgi:hypothetical protein
MIERSVRIDIDPIDQYRSNLKRKRYGSGGCMAGKGSNQRKGRVWGRTRGFIHLQESSQSQGTTATTSTTAIHNQVAGFRVDDRPRAMPIVPPPLFCHFHLLHPVILPVRYPVHPSGAGGMARSRPEYTRRMDEREHTQLKTLHGPYTSTPPS